MRLVDRSRIRPGLSGNRAGSVAVVGFAVALLGCGGGGDPQGDVSVNRTSSIAPFSTRSVVDADPYRILADQDGVGDEPSIVVIEDAAEFDSWWDEVGFAGRPPGFRPDSELIVGFTATYPSGCRYGFSDLRIRAEQRSVEASYYGSEPSDSCAADENPFTVVVAIDRAVLGAGTWEARMSVGGQITTFDVG